jgi:hypothetical protein
LPENVCRNWLNGRCRFGDRCRFAHHTGISRSSSSSDGNGIEEKEEKVELSFEERLKEDEFKRSQPAAEEDKIRLGDSGWNERYYSAKLGLDKNDPQHAAELRKYVSICLSCLSLSFHWLYRVKAERQGEDFESCKYCVIGCINHMQKDCVG